jgi:hypothetical protein
MPDSLKDCVHTMARRANTDNGLRFTDSDGNDLDLLYPDGDPADDNDADYDPAADELSYESDEDLDYQPPNDDVHSLVSIDPLADPAVNEGVGNTAPDGNHIDNNSNVNDDSSASNDSEDESDNWTPLTTYVDALEAKLDPQNADLDSTYDPAATYDESTDHDLSNDFEPIDQDEIPQSAREQTAADMDAQVDGNSDDNSAYSDNQPKTEPLPRLQQRCAPSYAHLKGRHGDGSLPTVARPHKFGGGKHQEAHIILQTSIVMTQYNLKQGILKFGDKGKQAMMTELQQLYGREVMQAVSKSGLTYDERRGALRYIMFLKEKQCGKLKGRGCADGRSQRDYMTKEDTSSPTVATKALMLSCMIDATEHRDVATCDIPGAFMQSKMEGKVIMKLEGVMADIIEKLTPNSTKSILSMNKESP